MSNSSDGRAVYSRSACTAPHAVADDRQVRGHADQDLHVHPPRAVAACGIVLVLDAAVERHDAGVVGALDQPGIVIGHPVVGLLALLAALDDLLEQTELVVDAVAVGRDRRASRASRGSRRPAGRGRRCRRPAPAPAPPRRRASAPARRARRARARDSPCSRGRCRARDRAGTRWTGTRRASPALHVARARLSSNGSTSCSRAAREKACHSRLAWRAPTPSRGCNARDGARAPRASQAVRQSRAGEVTTCGLCDRVKAGDYTEVWLRV